MNQCVLPAFPLGIVMGSGLERKLALTFHYSPAHTKLILAPKLHPIKKIITHQMFLVDETRGAFLAANRFHWVGFYFSELFIRELHLRYINSTPTHIPQNIRTRECPLKIVLRSPCVLQKT